MKYNVTDGKLLLTIQNNGVDLYGSVEAERCYESMRQRAQSIEAELDIQTDKNGISIILLVPLANKTTGR